MGPACGSSAGVLPAPLTQRTRPPGEAHAETPARDTRRQVLVSTSTWSLTRGRLRADTLLGTMSRSDLPVVPWKTAWTRPACREVTGVSPATGGRGPGEPSLSLGDPGGRATSRQPRPTPPRRPLWSVFTVPVQWPSGAQCPVLPLGTSWKKGHFSSRERLLLSGSV